ncbi:MAG TPA: hypothetical protein PKC25_02165, partial [Candidatus Rifleibacterium sp.]|nr:hypothetical protein [Candidatus Rifleibacterium sp.]
HEMHTYNPEVYAAISTRIRSLLSVNPGYTTIPGMVPDGIPTEPVPMGQIIPNPTGRKGDSN